MGEDPCLGECRGRLGVFHQQLLVPGLIQGLGLTPHLEAKPDPDQQDGPKPEQGSERGARPEDPLGDAGQDPNGQQEHHPIGDHGGLEEAPLDLLPSVNQGLSHLGEGQWGLGIEIGFHVVFWFLGVIGGLGRQQDTILRHRDDSTLEDSRPSWLA